VKTVNKMATAMAVALSFGIASQVSAEIMLKHNARGDALLFPAFQGSMENYFTIMNAHNEYIQGHLRFRGAGWSAELRDFDVILSPGDVMVFRVADVNGDGFWDIDQSLDPNNFAYTGLLRSCKNRVDPTQPEQPNCMNYSDTLVPGIDLPEIDEALIAYQASQGYVEFIAEGVFNRIGNTNSILDTKNRMDILKDLGNAGKYPQHGQRRIGSKLGTSLWSWTDADGVRGGAPNAFIGTARDVPNVLSGTAFVTMPGSGHGLAYNAEALVDFRTNGNPHRIDNYAADNAVIIHDENNALLGVCNMSGSVCGNSPFGDYVYGWPHQSDNMRGSKDDDQYEARVSFNNTWGPTLADGDDYDIPSRADQNVDPTLDDLDARMNVVNSIAEVEEAIRAGGQSFTSFYFDGGKLDANSPSAPLTSWYYGFFPTKFFYGERPKYYGQTSFDNYVKAAVKLLVGENMVKNIQQQIWDIEEHSPAFADVECEVSPCPFPDAALTIGAAYEVSYFTVDWLKSTYEQAELDAADYSKGRTVLLFIDNTPPYDRAFPGLLYTFEVSSDFLGHWRSMHR
jgi:hypothetical protein